MLPIDLQKLPPQALVVIRYLSTHDGQGTVAEIMTGTGLSERGFRKAIRRLVTRYYAEMPVQDFYKLTSHGQQAAEDIRVYDGEVGPAAATTALIEDDEDDQEDEEDEEKAPRHNRQLSMLVPKELVIGSTITLRAGFDAPADDDLVLLKEPGRVLLRLSVPGCDVTPVERPLEVGIKAPAGPVSFRVTPRREGPVQLKIEAFQLVTLKDIRLIGGMYFELNVAGFPTPDSGEVKALGAIMRLFAA